jgi:hypothetical protein
LVRFANRSNSRQSPRRHDVEPFWRSRGLDLNCAHEWGEAENDGQRRRCKKCHGIRSFVKKHPRGDATRGFVIQKRQVELKH